MREFLVYLKCWLMGNSTFQLGTQAKLPYLYH